MAENEDFIKDNLYFLPFSKMDKLYTNNYKILFFWYVVDVGYNFVKIKKDKRYRT
jgi:hypothetical protein